MLPAIVIAAYNRVPCLLRLLDSVGKAVYPSEDVHLIISIDKSDNPEVKNVADQFQWKHGKKELIEYDKNLGLKQHILKCGDLTEKYGSLILLEDDLFVSPYFYEYATQALSFYHQDENIAGISLYSYDISENGFFPFYPIDDGSDVYFVKMASSWGQTWNKEQWSGFRKWFESHEQIKEDEPLPDYILEWSKTSWKKHFVRYLIDANKFFVFPRLSLTSNFEEPGTNADTKGLYQVAIQEEKKDYCFKRLPDSNAIYDTWFEIEPESLKRLSPKLRSYDFAVDLYGTKNIRKVKEQILLTTKRVKNSVLSFGMEMIPNVLNVVHEIKGKEIFLANKEDVLETAIPFHKNFYKLETIREKIFKDILDERIEALNKKHVERTEALHKEYIQKIEGIYLEHNKQVADIYTKHHDEVMALHNNYGKKISEEVKSAIETFKFNLEYPLISIVTVVNDFNFSLLENTVNSVVSQNYPRLQYIIVDARKNGAAEISKKDGVEVIKGESAAGDFQNYETGFHKSQGDIMGWLDPESIYFNKSFQTVVNIFKKFRDINWVCGVPSTLSKNGSPVAESNLSQFRWSAKRFVEADFRDIQKLGKENIFWKRYLWEKAGSNLSKTLQQSADLELYFRFFHQSQLNTALVYFGGHGSAGSDSELRKKEFGEFRTKVPDGVRRGPLNTLFSSLLYPYYRMNIPVLRAVYLELNPFPEIIRFDYQSGSFYLSKF